MLRSPPPLAEIEVDASEPADDGQAGEQAADEEPVGEADEADEADAVDAATLEAQRAVLPEDADDGTSANLYWFVVPRSTSATFELVYSSEADAQEGDAPQYGVRFFGASGASYADAVQLLYTFVRDAAADDGAGRFFDITWTVPVVDDAAAEEADAPDDAAEPADDAAESDDDAAVPADDAAVEPADGADTPTDDAAEPADNAAAEPADDAVADEDAAGADDVPAPQVELTEQTIAATIYADENKDALLPEQGVTITLSGMLPDGATASAYPIDDVQIDGMSVLVAYDITAYNPDGSVFQPAEGSPILVTISSSALQVGEDEPIEVYHAETADDEVADGIVDGIASGIEGLAGSEAADDAEGLEDAAAAEPAEAADDLTSPADAEAAEPEAVALEAADETDSDGSDVAAVEVLEPGAVDDSAQDGDALEDADAAGRVSEGPEPETEPESESEPEPAQAIEGDDELQADSEDALSFEYVGTAERKDVATVSFYATHFSPYALAGPLRAPGNPGTIQTEDTRAVGITLNLFDYDAYDSSFAATNGVGNYSDDRFRTGINTTNGQQGGPWRDLRFYPSGIERSSTEYGNTINTYTGSTPRAMQGVVRPTLDANGYPHTTGYQGQSSNLSYLFDPNENVSGKRTYADVNHLFTLDEAGYYRYDSGWGKKDSNGNMRNGNYAYYDTSQGSGGDFIVYDRTYTNDNPANNSDASNDSIGFFPFDRYNEDNKNVKLDNYSGHYNHHFGLTMTASFMIPEGGTVNGNDMVFNFSGDDDMWVFIDDVLVLDIGGIHQPVSGSINFTQGTATINQAVASVSGQSTIGQNASIADIFAAAGKTWDGSEYSQHTIKCFYLERGGCYSDLSLSFNLPIYNPGQIHVTKTVDGPGSASYMDTGFKFKVFIETSQGSGEYEQYVGPVTMDDGTQISGADADGTYTLKSGEGFKVPTRNDKLRYYVQEIDPGSEFSTTINGQATGVTGGVVESPTAPIGEQPELNYKNSVTGVTVSVQKKWYEQDGTPQVEDLPESVSLTLHRTWDSVEGGSTAPTQMAHKVTFRLTSHAVSNAFVDEVIDVVDGGSLTFYPYGGVTSTGQGDPWSLPQVSIRSGSATLGSSNPPQQYITWQNVPGYTLSNITSDVTVLLYHNAWITVDPTRTDRAVPNVTQYTQVQPGSGTTPPDPSTVVHHDEVVETVTVTADTGWRHEWNGLPMADGQGNPYAYYVDESLVPAGYEVVYENNGGIPSGEITVKNQRAYTLPHTGGLGAGGLTALGVAVALCSAAALYFSQHRLTRRKREA